MNCKKIIKRIGIFFLCFLLFFFAVLSSYTKTTKAVVPALAIGAAAIAAFFSAAGISLTAQNIANSSTMSDTLNDLANQYSSETGAPTLDETIKARNALDYYYNSKASEAFISMSESCAQWFTDFKNWFVQKFGVISSASTTIIDSEVISTLSGNFPYYSTFQNVFDSNNVPLSLFPCVPDTSHTIQLTETQSVQINFGTRTFIGSSYWINVVVIVNNNGTYSSNSHNYQLSNVEDYSFIKVIFSNTNHTSPRGYLNVVMMPLNSGSYSGGYSLYTSIKLSDLNLENIGLTGQLTDGYSDFQDALNDAKSDAGENGRIVIGSEGVSVDRPYTEEGVAEGILNNTIANTGEGVLVGGYADEKEVEEETDSEKVPAVGEIQNNIVVVDGLEDFFPFCIPFDLYEIVKLLNVSPEAPKFNWKMNFGDTGIDDYDIEIDLSPYETVALVFRTLIIIGFLVFLTIKTRDLIRG